MIVKVRSVVCVLLCLCLMGCQNNKPIKVKTDSTETKGTPTITKAEYKSISPSPTIEVVKDSSTICTFDPSVTYQKIDGFGAAYTWYADRLLSKNNSEEAFDALFADAKLSILRFKNEYEYSMEDTDSNVNTMLQYFIEATNRASEYGEKVIVLMSCWSPPAYLKENNDITGAATLKKNEDGSYCYKEYADWWIESLDYYRSKGIEVSYISIQNECDYKASYDGCIFGAKESEQQASYAKAYLAVYDALVKHYGENAPKMIGPETMSCNVGTLSAYMKEIEKSKPESIYAIAHHLYIGGTSNEDTNMVDPASFITNFMQVASFFNEYKRWQTEFYIGHAIDTATLINNCMTYESANAYIYWSGVWEDRDSDFENGELLSCYNSTNTDDGWKLCADYYALRHFSEFIRPGYVRIKAISNDEKIRTSAYMNANTSKVVLVLINTGDEVKNYQICGTDYKILNTTAYQSVFGNECESTQHLFQRVNLQQNESKLKIPAKSVTTFEITGYYGEKPVYVPVIKKLPKFQFPEISEEDGTEEKTAYEGEFESADDTYAFENFGSSGAKCETSGGVDDTGCMRVTGRTADWNGITLATSRFTKYGYKARVSFDVMMKKAGNIVSCTSTFTKDSNSYYPNEKDCRVAQEITEAGVWYHAEGYVSLFEDMDPGTFRIYWESPGNTDDFYLDNVSVKLLYTDKVGSYEEK